MKRRHRENFFSCRTVVLSNFFLWFKPEKKRKKRKERQKKLCRVFLVVNLTMDAKLLQGCDDMYFTFTHFIFAILVDEHSQSEDAQLAKYNKQDKTRLCPPRCMVPSISASYGLFAFRLWWLMEKQPIVVALQLALACTLYLVEADCTAIHVFLPFLVFCVPLAAIDTGRDFLFFAFLEQGTDKLGCYLGPSRGSRRSDRPLGILGDCKRRRLLSRIPRERTGISSVSPSCLCIDDRGYILQCAQSIASRRTGSRSCPSATMDSGSTSYSDSAGAQCLLSCKRHAVRPSAMRAINGRLSWCICMP